MGIQQSKGELLYQQVSYGNSEVIRVLHRDGEDLEWMDREGKTPLILACMNAELYDVAKTLIELGSNVNAYRPARNAGTPLHHAAKRGLENTVKLLLSHGANPLVLDDDCQTPLEVARVKGFSNVVRAIESHICLFSGWMREFYGPTFLNLFAPQLLSRRVWVVIVPTGSRNPTKPFKLELVVYASLQDAQPRTVMPLWKANLEEPKAKQSDTSMMIVDNSTKTRLKLAPATEGDRQQLKWFCDACKGIPQPMHPRVFLQTAPSAPPPPPLEDALAMAVNASVHTTMSDTTNLNHYSVDQASSSAGPSSSTAPPPPSGKANTSIVMVLSSLFYILKFPWNINMQPMHPRVFLQTAPSAPPPPLEDALTMEVNASVHTTMSDTTNLNHYSVGQASSSAGPSSLTAPPPPSGIANASIVQGPSPSAPLLTDDDIAAAEDGPIHYPSIESTPVDVPSPSFLPASADGEKNEDRSSGTCAICLDAPSEAVCVPCGHIAGCMSCLNEIKSKKWGCPVCRAKIDQVIKVYRV